MGRKPERSSEKKSKDVVLKLTNKGAWTAEEDRKLVNYVLENGDKKWRTLPSKAGTFIILCISWIFCTLAVLDLGFEKKIDFFYYFFKSTFIKQTCHET